MKLIGNVLGVEFDKAHNKVLSVGLNGLDIIRADLWIAREDDGFQGSQFSENTNYLETLPQICTVKHPSVNHPYKEGDKLFVHYMAKECAERVDDYEVIDADFILFQIMPDETFDMVDRTYLGEQVYTEEEITPSGIIVSDRKKDGMKVVITHVPRRAAVKIGQTVITIDDKNYEINYKGKRYIKLVEHEIVGVVIN